MLEVLHPGSCDGVNWGNVPKKFRRKRNCVCRIVSMDSHRSNLRPRRVSCIPTMHKGLLEIPKKDSNDNGGRVKDNKANHRHSNRKPDRSFEEFPLKLILRGLKMKPAPLLDWSHWETG